MADLRDEICTRVQGAIKALNGLGSPAAIADHLGTLGIKGIVGRAASCPVANYVRLVAGLRGGNFTISANRWTLRTERGCGYPECCPNSEQETGATPSVVGAFVEAFDGGVYPELRS